MTPDPSPESDQSLSLRERAGKDWNWLNNDASWRDRLLFVVGLLIPPAVALAIYYIVVGGIP